MSTEVRKKLESILRVPLTKVVEHGGAVEIFINEFSLGRIPYCLVAGIPTYDTAPEILNRLKWHAFYITYQSSFEWSVSTQIGEEYKVITIGTWGTLYLKTNEDDEEPVKVNCHFDGKEWQLHRV